MPDKTAIQLFEEFCEGVTSTTSRTKKIEFVLAFSKKEDSTSFDLFLHLLHCALNPTVQYFVELLESPDLEVPEFNLEAFYKFLCRLSSKHIEDFQAEVVAADLKLGKWTRRLINKTLRLGLGNVAVNELLELQLPSQPWESPEKLILDDPLEWSPLFFELKGPCFLIPMPLGIEVMFWKKDNKVFPYSHFGFPLRNVDLFCHSVLKQFQDVREVKVYGKLVCGGAVRAVEAFSQSCHKSSAEAGYLSVAYWEIDSEITSGHFHNRRYRIHDYNESIIQPWQIADFSKPVPEGLCKELVREVWVFEQPTKKFYRIVVKPTFPASKLR